MKIGVLTYYGDLNFGTNLQAYSTLMAVKKTFPDDNVEIVPFHSFRNDIKPYLHAATPLSLWRDAKRIWKYNQFVKDHLHVAKDCIITDPQKGRDYISSFGYDRIYVGADTLLELDRLAKIGGDGLTAYWLGPQIQAKQYMLAASSKHTTFDSLSELQKKEIQKCVPNYSGILVRDKSTARLMSNVVGEDKVKLICDPTFTLDIDYSYVEQYVKNRDLDFENTICVHGWKQDECFLNGFAELAKKKGYKIASFRPAKFADILLNDMGPMEQAGIFRYFKCHVTHRFHDSVFCLKNCTPVVAYLPLAYFADKIGDSKYSALFDLFGIKTGSLINDKKSITPNSLMEMVENRMNVWNKAHINDVLVHLNDSYMKLLTSTK